MHSSRGVCVIASFLVGTAIDDTGYLGPSYRSGTHRAGFNGDVEGAVGEVLATQRVGCSSNGLHLGMSRDIAKGFCKVVRAGDDTILAHHDGTDRDFTSFKGRQGFIERHLHVALVFFLLFFAVHVAKIRFFLYLCKRIMNFKIIHIDETDSTNRWLRDNSQGETGVSSPEVVVAEYQTAGKGCGTNSWESERGKNLTFSVLLHPEEIPASAQFRISEVVSVALCVTLESYIYNKVEIKWPNDIYVGDRKICGILIENRLQGSTIRDSIIGIGLNVNQQTFTSDAPNPVSMCQLVGHEINRAVLLEAFLNALDETMGSDAVAVASEYRSRLYRRDGFYGYRDARGEFQAKLLNVLDDGRLVLLDTEGRARMYAFKEVVFIV